MKNFLKTTIVFAVLIQGSNSLGNQSGRIPERYSVGYTPSDFYDFYQFQFLALKEKTADTEATIKKAEALVASAPTPASYLLLVSLYEQEIAKQMTEEDNTRKQDLVAWGMGWNKGNPPQAPNSLITSLASKCSQTINQLFTQKPALRSDPGFNYRLAMMSALQSNQNAPAYFERALTSKNEKIKFFSAIALTQIATDKAQIEKAKSTLAKVPLILKKLLTGSGIAAQSRPLLNSRQKTTKTPFSQAFAPYLK